jgi:cell division protein FtsQ
MRRPSPLPPPPASRRPSTPPEAWDSAPVDEGELVAVASARPANASAAGTQRGDSEPGRDAAAPVIPITGATPARPPASLPEMGEPVDAADESDRIGVTDVWRAARARRKALRAEVRRFTGRQRRRRIAWIASAAAVVALVLATLGAAYSPLFAVETIRVVGADRLDAEDVATALDGQLGTPLPLVDESAVKAALVEFPVIESYALEARPPHELVVRIVERLPVGLIPSRAGYTLVDAAGVALSTTETPADGYPVIDVPGGTGTPAFEALGQVMRTLPASIRDQVTEISASTRDDVTFTLGDTDTTVVWGSAEDSAMKALVLEQTMKVRDPDDTSLYDVSSPSAVVVR